MEHLRKGNTLCYKGTLTYTNKRAYRANLNVCSEQSDEEVRISFLTEVLHSRNTSKTTDGWALSFTFPSPKTYFRVEVFRKGILTAYGYYWNKYGSFTRDVECNMSLTFVYKPTVRSSEEPINDTTNRESSFIIYIPNCSGGRNRRVRRGS